MLDAERFKVAYALAPHVDRRTTKGKAEWLQFCQESQGRPFDRGPRQLRCLWRANWMTLAGKRDIFKACKKG
jgi:hypothetical protein